MEMDLVKGPFSSYDRPVRFALIVLAVCRFAAQAAGLPFIHDDFGRARDESVRRSVPIFVDCWAPW